MKKDTKSTVMRAEQAHYTGDKAEYVRDMFAGIARRYDLLNSVLSFNRHKAWRKHAVKLAELKHGDSALDVCSGTGDFAIHLSSAVGESGQVTASDFCRPMLEIAKSKINQSTYKVQGRPDPTDPPDPPDVFQSKIQNPKSRITLSVADVLHLPYRSNLFDAVTVGFGIRNVADIQQAFKEMTRVAKPGGRVVCLEFNNPRNPILRPIVAFYETRILPIIGRMLSRSEAYTYLQKSIKAFHSREELTAIMRNAGLTNINVTDLNLGSVCIHLGTKA